MAGGGRHSGACSSVPCPEFSPTLMEILAAERPTYHHVPKGAVPEVARALAGAIIGFLRLYS